MMKQIPSLLERLFPDVQEMLVYTNQTQLQDVANWKILSNNELEYTQMIKRTSTQEVFKFHYINYTLHSWRYLPIMLNMGHSKNCLFQVNFSDLNASLNEQIYKIQNLGGQVNNSLRPIDIENQSVLFHSSISKTKTKEIKKFHKYLFRSQDGQLFKSPKYQQDVNQFTAIQFDPQPTVEQRKNMEIIGQIYDGPITSI